MRKFLLLLTGALLLAGALDRPIQLHADGGPGPQCPPGHTCKP